MRLTILRVAIKEANLLDGITAGVTGNAGDIDDTKSRAVVGLVGETIDDVLVVVDGAGRALEETSVDGSFEIGDVEDVGGGVAVRGRTDLFLLVELVVEKEIFHGLIDKPALVAVGVANVRGAGDDDGVLLVGHIHDSQSVLVECEADLALIVLLAGSSVDDALSVMYIAILANATGRRGFFGIGNIDHEEATSASGVAGIGTGSTTDSVDHVDFLVRDDVVRGSEAGEKGDILLLAKDLGLLDVEQLVEVKDLQSVVSGLGANIGVILDDLDVTPTDHFGLGVETTEIHERAILLELDKSDTISLADNAELTFALLGCPTPNIVADHACGAQILMTEEAS